MKRDYFISVDYCPQSKVSLGKTMFAYGVVEADLSEDRLRDITKEFLEEGGLLEQPFEDTWYKITNFNLI